MYSFFVIANVKLYRFIGHNVCIVLDLSIVFCQNRLGAQMIYMFLCDLKKYVSLKCLYPLSLLCKKLVSSLRREVVMLFVLLIFFMH